MIQQPLFIDRSAPKKPRGSSAQKRIDDLETISMVRLSKNFILRDFLFSTEVSALGLSNYPEDVDQVIRSGKALCERLLEPILAKFGRFAITFGFQCRKAVERQMSARQRAENPRSSSPHQWDRGTFGGETYARVDILPYVVEDGFVSKMEFGQWLMMNLDIDLLMAWKKSNVFCISISPRPRRVFFEWGDTSLGQPRRETFIGAQFWQSVYPALPENERPKFAPSCSGGSVQWRTK